MQNFWKKLPPPIIALAPMAGYTDSAFRLLCRQFGADIVYSEMISVDAIIHHNQKTLSMLEHNKKEYPLVLQLFGNDPNKFEKAVKIINNKIANHKSPITNHLLGIDINFGCPAHKVTNTGSGASLMDKTDKAYNIIKAVCDNSKFPVSIKIRTKVRNITAETFINKVKNLPWSAVMIHGRTLSQGFTGEIDYAAIKKIKKILPDKIVLANGGIYNYQTAKTTLQKTQADGLGIARGAWGNPWIFNKEFILSGVKNPTISISERKKIMLQHARLFLKYNDNLIPLRKNLIHYVKGTKNASLLRQKIIKIVTLNDLKKIIT